jgi:hypothetical protein
VLREVDDPVGEDAAAFAAHREDGDLEDSRAGHVVE